MDPSLRSAISLDRRGFLAHAACGAAATLVAQDPWPVSGAVAARLDAAAGSPWKMRLSCSSINFSSLPIEQACERIAALGFEAIDIWSAHAGCPHLDDVPSGWVRWDSRICWPGTTSSSTPFRSTPAAIRVRGAVGQGRRRRGRARQRGALQARGAHRPMKTFLEALKPEVDLAEKYNSYLAIENHGGSLLDSLDSFRAFCDLNKNPPLGIALAPYHLQAAGVGRRGDWIVGRQLFFFYAWQHAPGEQQLPGMGPTDCHALAGRAGPDRLSLVRNPFMHDEPQPDAMSTALARSRDYLRAAVEERKTSHVPGDSTDFPHLPFALCTWRLGANPPAIEAGFLPRRPSLPPGLPAQQLPRETRSVGRRAILQ